MTATTHPDSGGSPRSMVGFLDDSPPYVRPILFAVGGLALLSIVRILAGAPDLTAGDTFIAAIGAMSPIVFAALGGLFSERVGVVNIGLEGMMILGHLVRRLGGLALGAVGGHRRRRLRRRARWPAPRPGHGDLRRRPHRGRHRHQPARARRLPVPVQRGVRRATRTGPSRSPRRCRARIGRFTFPFVAGGSLFGWKTPDLARLARRAALVLRVRRWPGWAGASPRAWPSRRILALALVPISAYVLWRTPFGLRLRSIGEKPSAADSLGVAVYRMKYIGVTISGAPGRARRRVAGHRRPGLQREPGRRPRLPGPGRADLRQLAPGRPRRRRRAVRVRAVARPSASAPRRCGRCSCWPRWSPCGLAVVAHRPRAACPRPSARS